MRKLTGGTGFTFLVPASWGEGGAGERTGTFALQRLITNIESTSSWKSR